MSVSSMVSSSPSPLTSFLNLASNHTLLPTYEEIAQSYHRIQPFLRYTPLEPSPALQSLLESLSTPSSSASSVYPLPSFYIKLESEQVTGSFKARGAVTCITALCEALDSSNLASSSTNSTTVPSICTASTGNHALAINYALHSVPQAKKYDLLNTARIYLPKNVAQAKLDSLRAARAPLYIIDTNDCIASELAAIEYSKTDSSIIYISPYNNYYVVMGQGTIGLEIMYQFHQISLLRSTPTLPILPSVLISPLVILVPTGGGGMISGIACAIKKQYPYPQSIILACQPATNACMLESVIQKRVLPEGEFNNGDTWSDGTAGGIEDHSCTFTACQYALTKKEEILNYLHRSKELFYKLQSTATDSSVPPRNDMESSRLVDGIVTCTEEEIEHSMLFMLSKHHKVSKTE